MNYVTRQESLTITSTGDWQAVYSHPFLQDLEVVGLCRASDISPQLKIVLVEE
jgi:hypothetical protein